MRETKKNKFVLYFSDLKKKKKKKNSSEKVRIINHIEQEERGATMSSLTFHENIKSEKKVITESPQYCCEKATH